MRKFKKIFEYVKTVFSEGSDKKIMMLIVIGSVIVGLFFMLMIGIADLFDIGTSPIDKYTSYDYKDYDVEETEEYTIYYIEFDDGVNFEVVTDKDTNEVVEFYGSAEDYMDEEYMQDITVSIMGSFCTDDGEMEYIEENFSNRTKTLYTTNAFLEYDIYEDAVHVTNIGYDK